jgi:uncharacterized protein YbbC (DUF1343 family)
MIVSHAFLWDRYARRVLWGVLCAISAITCAREPASLSPAPVRTATREVATSETPAPEPLEATVASLSPDHEARIDAAVDAAIRERQAPGAVVAVVRPEGLAFLRAYGSPEVSPVRVALRDDALFDLASLTKPFTALAVMRLVEAKKLALDDPVAKHRPSFGAGGKSEVTIAELMLHTSGLPAANPLSDFEGDVWARIDALPLTGRGQRRYSDVGYLLLGELIARRSSVPLAQVIAREVTEPLRMTETVFSPVGALAGRAVPTEPRGGVMLRGAVHDPRAALLGGAAGHAGLFSTARDLSRLLRMIMAGGLSDGAPFLTPESLGALRGPPGEHGLGFSPALGGFGHLGFTGTMLWIAPSGRLGAIVLTSRLHPDGRGDVTKLRDAIRRIVLDADQSTVLTGADVVADDLGPLRGRRVGLVMNHTAVTRDGRRTADLLHASPEVELVALFAPEHGPAGTLDAHVADGRDAATGLVVHSLYGEHRRPTKAQLAGIDTLVFDLQDAGARFYTYVTTLGYLLEVAAAQRLRVVVLDRPNPLGGVVVEGPLLDDDLRSFVGYHSLPIRHGLTVGELARLYAAERRLEVDLSVVTMRGWRRAMLYEDTGLAWRPPSPNLPSPRAALLYPGVAIAEGTNLSVGRGTPRPFEQIGAPWLDAPKVLAAMPALDGVAITATAFTPNASKFANIRCSGLAFRVTDEQAFRPVRLGIALALALGAVHPRTWRAAGMLPLLGDRDTFDAIRSGRPLDELMEAFDADLDAFEHRRAAALLYP